MPCAWSRECSVRGCLTRHSHLFLGKFCTHESNVEKFHQTTDSAGAPLYEAYRCIVDCTTHYTGSAPMARIASSSRKTNRPKSLFRQLVIGRTHSTRYPGSDMPACRFAGLLLLFFNGETISFFRHATNSKEAEENAAHKIITSPCTHNPPQRARAFVARTKPPTAE